MSLLKDRFALVTGATGALGKAISLALARAGCNVAVHYHRRETEARQLVDELGAMGRRAMTVRGDITSVTEVESLFSSVQNEFGRIDILINNAGITRDRLILGMSQRDWEDVVRTNLFGTFNCLQAVAPIMILQKEGVIINISSVTAEYGWPGQSNYAASKAGIDAITRCAAAEFARFNIRVNSVAPGMLGLGMGKFARDLVGERLINLIPLARFGLPDEVAQMVLFLSSRQASYISGEVFRVSGGLGMGLPATKSNKGGPNG